MKNDNFLLNLKTSFCDKKNELQISGLLNFSNWQTFDEVSNEQFEKQ